MPDRAGYMMCLKQLAEQTLLMRDAVEAQEWDKLIMCLEERQALMNRINLMQQAGMDIPEEERKRALQLLEQIGMQDREVMPKLESAMEKVRTSMKEHQLAHTTLSAYRKTARPLDYELQARFVDRQR